MKNRNKSSVFETIKNLVSLVKLGQIASLKISGRDIVLLLGKTGAGKSSLIHFLHGIKISVRVQDAFDDYV